MTESAQALRSIRLNQSHRADMAQAVMAEWEKQNPAPASPGHIALLEVIAPQLKKHASHRRTARLTAAMEGGDEQHVKLECDVNVAIMNKQGEQRNVIRVNFPLSVAKRLGLSVVPHKHTVRYVDDFALADLDENDLANEDYDDQDRYKLQRLCVKCACFIEACYPTVQIDDHAPAMVAMREARKARQEWEKQRDTLGRETRDLLDNFNTTKQLREGWPEIVPYLPPHIADTRGVNLPVMETSRLSERLGIRDQEPAHV